MVTAQNIQRFVGGVLAIYGFFVAGNPTKYTIPYLESIIPNLTLQQESWVGIGLFLVGLVLFLLRKPILEL